MKKQLLLTLLGIGATLSNADAQVLSAGRFYSRVNTPVTLPAPGANFMNYQLRRDSAGVFNWYVRDNSGTYKVGGGGAFALPTDVVRQNGNANLANLGFTGGLFYRNRFGRPPKAAPSASVWVLGFNDYNEGSGVFDGGAREIDLSRLGLRAVASAATHSSDPGLQGDVFVGSTFVDLWAPKIGGGTTVVRFNNVTTSFNPPGGTLPNAPTLSASLSGATLSLTWTVVTPPDVTGWEFYWRQGGSGNLAPYNDPNAQILGGAARSWTGSIPGSAQTPGAWLYYQMRGVNASGGGFFSNLDSVQVASGCVSPACTTPAVAVVSSCNGYSVGETDTGQPIVGVRGEVPLTARDGAGNPIATGQWVHFERKPGKASEGGAWAEIGVKCVAELQRAGQVCDYLSDIPAPGYYAYRVRVRCGASTYSAYSAPMTFKVEGDEGTLPALTTLTRPQPNSTRLVPTPELAGDDNWTDTYQLDRFPNFSAPNGFETHFFCDASRNELLKFLQKGMTAVDAGEFLEEYDGTGQTIGRQIPYNRRARVMYENSLEGNGGIKYRRGDHPSTYNSAENDDIRRSTLGFFDDRRAFADGKASYFNWVDFETCAYCGQAYEDYIRDYAVNPLMGRINSPGFPFDIRVSMTNRPLNGAWVNPTGWGDVAGYFKTAFFTDRRDYPGDEGVRGFNTFPDFWREWQDKQGSWIRLALGNTEWFRAVAYPGAKAFSKWTPYDERGQTQTDRAGLWPYYLLRPDVAENAPIVMAFAGGRGVSLWNIGMRPGEPKAAIERHLRGIWRLAQYADIIDGTHTADVAEFSLDGGVTWITPKNGAAWGGFEANVTNGFVPYITGTNQPVLNVPALADRIQTRVIRKGSTVLLMAIDAWNNQGTNLDIRVRYGTLTDSIRLYGRNCYLGRGTL